MKWKAKSHPALCLSFPTLKIISRTTSQWFVLFGFFLGRRDPHVLHFRSRAEQHQWKGWKDGEKNHTHKKRGLFFHGHANSTANSQFLQGQEEPVFVPPSIFSSCCPGQLSAVPQPRVPWRTLVTISGSLPAGRATLELLFAICWGQQRLSPFTREQGQGQPPLCSPTATPEPPPGVLVSG